MQFFYIVPVVVDRLDYMVEEAKRLYQECQLDTPLVCYTLQPEGNDIQEKVEVFRDLFHRYRDDVYRLAFSYTRSLQEAEDVCQTVFLKLLECGELDSGREKAWLMQVTANECRDLLRSAWWKRTVPMVETPVESDRQTDETIWLLRKLPPKYRVVLYLYYYEQYTTGEISALLKISRGTVSTRLNRGREQLKHMLKED